MREAVRDGLFGAGLILAAGLLWAVFVGGAQAQEGWSARAFCKEAADWGRIATIFRDLEEPMEAYQAAMADPDLECYDGALMGFPAVPVDGAGEVLLSVPIPDGRVVQFVLVRDLEGTRVVTWRPVGRGA